MAEFDPGAALPGGRGGRGGQDGRRPVLDKDKAEAIREAQREQNQQDDVDDELPAEELDDGVPTGATTVSQSEPDRDIDVTALSGAGGVGTTAQEDDGSGAGAQDDVVPPEDGPDTDDTGDTGDTGGIDLSNVPELLETGRFPLQRATRSLDPQEPQLDGEEPEVFDDVELGAGELDGFEGFEPEGEISTIEVDDLLPASDAPAEDAGLEL